MSEMNGYLGHPSWEARGIQEPRCDTYEPPEIRNLGNAREVFLGGTTGSASDCFKAPKNPRTCS